MQRLVDIQLVESTYKAVVSPGLAKMAGRWHIVKLAEDIQAKMLRYCKEQIPPVSE